MMNIRRFFCSHGGSYSLKGPVVSTRANPQITTCSRCGKELRRYWQYEDMAAFNRAMENMDG